jgi:aryl-alcohol dehydrogenase-like predicted oxidoreductase
MENISLGRSELSVSRICLGTMTFGEQVDQATAHRLLDHAVARGINFIDTAEMYSVPPRAATYGATETIIGHWFAADPARRAKLVLATKVAGPSRGSEWIRKGSPDLTADDIVTACEDSLRRLQTEVIDLYQIHWPVRHMPMFGGLSYNPQKETPGLSSLHEQLEGLARLVRAGKVRHVGLSNETPYGVCEFVHLAEQHGLPRVASVQNPYSLVNRVLETGLDEAMHHHDVSLLAYSPLAFGVLTGKYDSRGLDDPSKPGRMAIYESMKKQRWGRDDTLAAARRYNALARAHGLTPTRMALAWCYTRWQTASTIIGVTNQAQLDENIDAWGTVLSPELVAQIDQIRWEMRDPAQ